MKKNIQSTKSILELFIVNLLPEKQQDKVKGGDGIIIEDKIMT